MNEQRLAEIKKRAEAATSAPWSWSWSYDSGLRNFDALRSGHRDVIADGYSKICGMGIILTEDDAEFIAHARTDIPWLIEEIERLKAEIEQLRASEGGE